MHADARAPNKHALKGEIRRLQEEGAKHDVVCELNAAAEEVLARQGETPTPKRSPKARLVRASEVTARRVEWLWPGRIPFGMLTLLDGDPGLGKSTLTLDLVARVTTGDMMPDGGPWVNGGRGRNAIVLMLEDSIDVTIRPRLEAAKADLERVLVMTGVREVEDQPDTERPPVIPVDLAVLREVILEHEACLVVIDPLMAYLGGDTDSHKDQDIRRALTPMARLAEDTGAAIIIVRHLRKTGGPALYRGGGSIGIMGSARTALYLAPDPSDPEARVLAVSKSNIAPIAPTLRWRHVKVAVPTPTGDAIVSRAQWEGVAEGVTADMLANHAPDSPGKGDDDAEPKPGQVDLAADALRAMLAEGPVPGAKAEREIVAELECSDRTVRRACKKLGVVKTPHHGKNGRVAGWEWALPDWPGGQVATPDLRQRAAGQVESESD